jgi:predicted amidohydrolase YtcJ
MITRRDPYGQNPGVLGPEQAMDLASVLRIFTINGAESMYAADSRGSIAPGKSADFIVLDRNLFEIPVEDISEVKVLRTVFRGKTVYSQDDSK